MINKIIRRIFKLGVMDNNKYVINGSSISVITPIMDYLTTPSTRKYYFHVYAGDFTLVCYSYSYDSLIPQVLIDTRDLFIHKMGFSYIELENQSNLMIDIITKYNEKK